jgi:hypothetical protein
VESRAMTMPSVQPSQVRPSMSEQQHEMSFGRNTSSRLWSSKNLKRFHPKGVAIFKTDLCDQKYMLPNFFVFGCIDSNSY